jgi:hypothetical protein
MSEITQALVVIALAIVGVAIVSVLVSRKSNTTGVIQAAASGFGNSLAVATAPVTGASTAINLSYPGESNGLSTLSNSFPQGF